MSKSKENIPAQNGSRVGASKVNLTHTGQSDDFFTDSILESDATRTSKIPTPVPQKSIHIRSHRARKSNKAASQRNNRAAIEQNGTVEEPLKTALQPPISIRRSKSPSPLRTDIAATPPQVRHHWDLESPVSDLRSPPPREFTDVYRQIADEEDLAATEREFSDSDGSLPLENEDEPAILIHQHLGPQTQSQIHPEILGARSPTSRGSTPIQQGIAQVNNHMVTDNMETMSEPTGMSFLNELTDQRLAAVLTPHMSESAKDRARLREVWSNQKPIAFAKGRRTSPHAINLAHDSDRPTQRVKAFSKATGIRFNGTHSDQSSRPASRHSDSSIENYRPRDNTWDDFEQPLKQLPTNNRIERNFHFSRHHGFPTQRIALTEKNLQQQNHVGRSENQINIVHGERHNDIPAKSPEGSLRNRIHSGSDYSGRAQKIREKLLGINKSNGKDSAQTEESQVDWEAAGGREELHAVPPGKSTADSTGGAQILKSAQRQASPDKSRRWDIDLTGQSFQVSESPPVRNKVPANEGVLGKEIESLTKRAVTTSRLGEIRERHSQEGLRSKSRSPVPRSASVSSEKRRISFGASQSAIDNRVGEAVPDTPVVIYRSGSNGSEERRVIEHGNDSKTNSDEFLQRFARAMSNTPKSSPSTTGVAKPQEQDDKAQSDGKLSQGSDKSNGVRGTTTLQRNGMSHVTETPKVIGAWTDTILPDTVKTIKQQGSKAGYLQTPHISAGGWIDTPLPTGIGKVPEMTPIIEEIPEELTNGIVRSKGEGEVDDKLKQEDKGIEARSHDDLPKIGLAGILDRAKQRLISQDITTASRDNDTLNLGNETIESLQDLLTLDADEFTVLSKVFNEEDDGPKLTGAEEEAAILERIGTKLDRLKSNIHEARKGISQLEHKVSQPGPNNVLVGSHNTAEICTMCNAPISSASSHSHSTVLPVAPLYLKLPIPLLFYPQTEPSPLTAMAEKRSLTSRLPRPTPLGYITITIWLWYVVECTFSEIYSHPTHAEYYTWPSPHEAEPEFPFVLPTMLSRWFQLDDLQGLVVYFFGWVFTFTRASFRVLGMWFGLTDGFVDDGVPSLAAQGVSSASGSFSSILRSLSSTAMSTALGGVETDLSMMNDEYL